MHAKELLIQLKMMQEVLLAAIICHHFSSLIQALSKKTYKDLKMKIGVDAAILGDVHYRDFLCLSVFGFFDIKVHRRHRRLEL